MISIDESMWLNLVKPKGEDLAAKLPFPEITRELFIAYDSLGYRHILIILTDVSTEFNDEQSKGVKVVTKALTVAGEKPKMYLDLQCINSSGFSIFNSIGCEIAVELNKKEKKPEEIIYKVLSKWRRFWGAEPLHLLSLENQIGLFGELWFLVRWLFPKYGPNVINSWKGPWGSRHDFELADKSFEVKASISSKGHIHTINGINQLDNPVSGVLYLFSLCLREETAGDYNLPKLIDECEIFLASDFDALNLLETALIKEGYSPVHKPEYEKKNFTVTDNLLFIVNDDFPHITKNSFVGGLPPSIEHIGYVINLNMYSNLIVSRSDTDFITLESL